MRELLTAECLTTSPAEDHASLSSLSVDHDKKKKRVVFLITEAKDSYWAEKKVLRLF